MSPMKILVEGSPLEYQLYAVFRDYAKHEDDLINGRLNWNFTIQGFLFTTYGLSLQKIAEVRSQLIKPGIPWVRSMDYASAVHELRIFMIVIAIVGIFVSAFVHLSVWAARIALYELELKWMEHHGRFPERGEKVQWFDKF